MQAMDLQNKLKEILGKLPGTPATCGGSQGKLDAVSQDLASAPVYEVNFPELFVF